MKQLLLFSIFVCGNLMADDKTTTISQLKEKAIQVIEEREWKQFHTPKDLAMNLSCESNEYMEHFLWLTPEQQNNLSAEKRKEIAHEAADVFFTLLLIAEQQGFDLTEVFEEKLEIIKKKYPVEKSKGRNEKYTTYQEQKNKSKNN